MRVAPPPDLATVLADLGCVVFERGWLSSNNILFSTRGTGATLVDTGYSSHAEQTLRLVEAQLAGQRLDRIVNTHLHSDHCGGNARLHEALRGEVWVPEVSVEVVRRWDEDRLTYRSTGQSCSPFPVHGALRVGDSIRLGHRDWRIVGAPGHDPDAVMLFEPESRTLLAGDALWESRLAIIFPELVGESGFAEAGNVLEVIESLAPTWVIPGHGSPFCNVGAAISASRSRLARFQERPSTHTAHAIRALVMFRMLEIRSSDEGQLLEWIDSCPLFLRARETGRNAVLSAAEVVQSLVDSGSLVRDSGIISLPK